ncbi:T9SS type A sorting domain-containing protein [Olleya aquimaris]|uniref:Putative secreted protein (Por secretion system target) n=1 Tax=Olleya aquimaris TaxID=639310 RepID=A0A327R9I3_9FLAO|nr:T9SS type A sorting domain-containing protein [Olleya aquimaris]RAJ13469.1 putative secreted protein (Por secretion system target) [Olleya aquimaris]
MYKLLLNLTIKVRVLLTVVTLIFSFQANAFDDTNCGNISGFQFSNGSEIVTISNDQAYYFGDLPTNFYVDLLVVGFSESAKFEVKNKTTGQTYNITENHLPYTFPGGNAAWNFGYGEFEVKAKIYKYNSCQGSYCDSETIKFEILSTPPCGSIAGFQFSNGTSTVAIVDNAEYSLDQLPTGFYVDLLVNGFSESASFRLKNLDSGQEYTIGENHLPYTTPGGNAAWSYGTGEFELKAKIFEFNNCQGSYCDSETIKFKIIDVIVPDCDCQGGMVELTFAYSGGGSITTNSGTITDNGDGTYTVSNNGLKLEKNLQIVTSGCYTAAIHTSCSQDVLGVTFTGGVQVVGYVDSEGNSASLTDGCTQAPVCGDVLGFVLTDGVTSIPIVDGDSYDINALPANFYVGVLLSGFPESVRFEVKNEDTGDEFVSIDNDEAFTYPSDGTPWSLGISEFKVKAEIYDMDNAMGDKCDYDYLKFTLYDGSIPDCPCEGGLVELTFAYSGTGTVTTNSGTVVNNGDGTYTATATDDKLEKDFEVYINGATAQIHTSCSQDLLGITFDGLVQVIGYVDTNGNTASINDGCGQISDCGSITGFEFSNFSDPTVALVDGGTYNINDLPTNFNINVLTTGNIESAFNTLTNLDTGEVYTKLENVLPYTFPGATNQVWNLGCGTFSFCSTVYKQNQASGEECDTQCLTFTITNCCGSIDDFVLTDGTESVSLVDGGVYNLMDLPTNPYFESVVSGNTNTIIYTVLNTDTNTTTIITENDFPYTYPANGAAWDLGLGNFQVTARLYTISSGDDCDNSTDKIANVTNTKSIGGVESSVSFSSTGGSTCLSLCEVKTISFTLEDGLQCDDTVFAGTGTLSANVVLVNPAVNSFVTITPNGNAVLPQGYQLGTVLTSGNSLTIQRVSNSTTIQLPAVGGNYKVHMLAYDPLTLDLDNDIIIGVTTASDVLNLINDSLICANLDVNGSPILVILAGSTDRVASSKTNNSTNDMEEPTEFKSEETSLVSDLKLYPNPVINELNVNITLLEGEVFNYSMIDLNGKQVLSGTLSNNSNVIRTKALAAGLYILKLESERRTFTKKILVNK